MGSHSGCFSVLYKLPKSSMHLLSRRGQHMCAVCLPDLDFPDSRRVNAPRKKVTSRFSADIFFHGCEIGIFEIQSVDFYSNRDIITTSISRHGYRNLACPCLKAVPQLLVVFCVRTGFEINCQLLRRPSCDQFLSSKSVVVKDDHPMIGFMRDDRAGYES